MKIIAEQQGIKLEQITDIHFVVGFIQQRAVMLQKTHYSGKAYKFCVLEDLTRNNGYEPTDNTTIRDTIKSYMESDNKFEVFNTWQEAMEWLMKGYVAV